jgi:hypothetical protein
MLVVLLDGLAHVPQAIRRNDERQIALFHKPLFQKLNDRTPEWPEDFLRNP